MKTKKKSPEFSLWRSKRIEYKSKRKPIFILTILAIFAGLYVMRKEWGLWEMTSASAIFVFVIFELTCYYYCFLILLAPLAYQRARDRFGLIAMVVASQIIQIRVGANDEEYLWESLFVALACFGLLGGRVFEMIKGKKSLKEVPS